MLTLENLNKSIKNENPENLILHSDHGSHYSSHAYIKLCKENNITRSMSRVGNSLDNRPVEFFFRVLKQEYLKKFPIEGRTIQNLQEQIEFIMFDYNNVRMQRCLNSKTPNEYV